MIYGKRKVERTTEKQDLNKIWKCLKTECKVYFKKKQLKALWVEFSQREYSAGFLIPNYSGIDHFISWLWLYKNKEVKQ